MFKLIGSLQSVYQSKSRESEVYIGNGPIISVLHLTTYKRLLLPLPVDFHHIMHNTMSGLDIKNINNSDEDSVYDPMEYVAPSQG